MLEFLDNLQSTNVGADHTGQEPDDEDADVLDRPEGEVQLRVVRVPVSGRVYDSGRHQGEGGHLDCPQQRYQELQPGHGGSQSDCEDDIHNIIQ